MTFHLYINRYLIENFTCFSIIRTKVGVMSAVKPVI